eukprot:5379908-Amphidinium_carterae.1
MKKQHECETNVRLYAKMNVTLRQDNVNSAKVDGEATSQDVVVSRCVVVLCRELRPVVWCVMVVCRGQQLLRRQRAGNQSSFRARQNLRAW